MVLVFSTTKGVAAATVADARSRGLFDYEDRVATHWPGFGTGGKGAVTIRQLLDHQAGLAAPSRRLDPDLIADTERLSAMLAAREPEWEPGTRHGYHAFTLGWYESELIRRADPEGRTLGEYFADEVAAPLDLDFHVGVPEAVSADRIAEVQGFAPARMLLHLHRFPWRMVLALANPRSLTARARDCFDVDSPADLNSPAYRAVEIPAANGVGRVRDVAKVYGALATDGGDLAVDRETLDDLAAPPRPPSGGRRDLVLKTDASYSLGFWKPFPDFPFGTGERAFGTPGAGGSFGFADPDAELGFAYAPNRMGFGLWDDPRERALREEVYECLPR
jgi:CubicO group peptidase (beta-lactamase class C family)